jgi:hypothetical protein
VLKRMQDVVANDPTQRDRCVALLDTARRLAASVAQSGRTQ